MRFAKLLSLLLLAPHTVLAESPSLITGGIPNCDFADGRIHADCIPSFLIHVIQQVFMLTGAASVIMIIIGGYQYALGNAVGGKEKGQASIKWGVLGLVISAFAFFIIDFVISTIAGL